MGDTGTDNGSSGRSKERTVAVTGASGFVGREIVARLVAGGDRVRALVRDQAKGSAVLADAIESGDVELVEGDLSDARRAEDLVRGADACVHLVGIIREKGRDTFRRVHVEATRSILRACESVGPERYLHMSALGARDDGVSAYQKTKFEAELAVRASGLAWTIFRPGLIHGPDGEFMRMAKGWCEGRAAPHLFIPCFGRLEDGWAPPRLPRFVAPTVAPVHVGDVAGAFVDAIAMPATIGEVYNLVGSESLGFDRMLEHVRDALPLGKRSLRTVTIPGRLAALKATAARHLGFASALPFDEGMALMGSEDATADLVKARAHLGFDPVPFRASMSAYADAM